MRNAGLEQAQAGIKIAGRNISNLRYADDIPAGRAALGLRSAGAAVPPARPFALGVLPVSSVKELTCTVMIHKVWVMRGKDQGWAGAEMSPRSQWSDPR